MDSEDSNVSLGEPCVILKELDTNLADSNMYFRNPYDMDFENFNMSFSEIKNVSFGELHNMVFGDMDSKNIENELPISAEDNSNQIDYFSEEPNTMVTEKVAELVSSAKVETPSNNSNLPNTKYKLVYCPKCQKTLDYVPRNVKCATCKTAFMYKCAKCMKLYKTNNALHKHLYRCFDEISKFFCNDCQYKTRSKYLLTEHIEVKHLPRNLNSHKCRKCGKCYLSRKGFRYHSMYCGQPNDFKNDSELKRFCCDHCSYESLSKRNISSHIESKHLPCDKNKCSKCAKSYSSQSNLVKHLKICGVPKDLKNALSLKRFCCDHCKYQSTRKSHLVNHILSKHLPRDPNLNKCSRCAKSYSMKSNLVKHLKICGVPKDSKRLSVGIKFSCSYCDYIAYFKSELTRHVQSKHLPKDQSLNKCIKCDKRFSWVQSLRAHSKTCGIQLNDKKLHPTVHRQAKDLSSENTKRSLLRFNCVHCLYKTNYKAHLSEHMKVKHLPRDFNPNKCSKCGKSYSWPQDLCKHIKKCDQKQNLMLHSHDHSQYETADAFSQMLKIDNQAQSTNNGTICRKTYPKRSILKMNSKACQPKDSENASKLECVSSDNWKQETQIKKELPDDIQTNHLPGNSSLNKCSEYKRSYSMRSSSQRHSKVGGMPKKSKNAPKSKKFCCDHCKYKTGSTFHFTRHIKSKHLPLDPQLNKCSKCEKIYSSLWYLREHSKICGQPKYSRHLSKLNIFNCDHCNYKTDHRSHFTRHLQSKHLPRDPNLNTCGKCAKSYSRKSDLLNHLKFCGQQKDVEHSSKLKSFFCDHCLFKTNYKAHLSEHIKVKHLPRDFNSNKCSKCGKCYSWASDLQKHAKICDQTKNPTLYSCDDCNYKTHRKSHLSIHIQNQHLPRDPNLNKCIKCKKCYSSQCYLRKHVKICKSKVINFSSLSESFSCDHCKYKTRQKTNLSNHIHAKHLPRDSNLNNCNNCGKSFSRRSSLSEHFKVCEQTKTFLSLLRLLPLQNQDGNSRLLFKKEPEELWKNYKRTLLLVLQSLKKN